MGRFDFINEVDTNDRSKWRELYASVERLMDMLKQDLKEYCNVIFDSVVSMCSSINDYNQKCKKMHPETPVAETWRCGLCVEFEKGNKNECDNKNMIDITVYVVQLDDLEKAEDIEIDIADPFTTLCHIKVESYDLFYSAYYVKDYGEKSWRELVELIGRKIFFNVLYHSHCVNSFTHVALEKSIDKYLRNNARGRQNIDKVKRILINPKLSADATD